LIPRGNMYYLKKDDKEDGPFCFRCWDAEKLLVRVFVYDNGQRICPQCSLERRQRSN
jgi:hypothetical protein